MLRQESGVEDAPDLEYPSMQNSVSVVLICPNSASRLDLLRALAAQRAAVAGEFTAYPSYAHLPSLIELDCDSYIIEMDTDQDVALECVETICDRKPSATVMVYTSAQDTSRMMAAMRAGAREFLAGNIQSEVLKQALLRAAARRNEQAVKKSVGKISVFWGAKGGCGVTTLACNFAIGLRHESGGEVLLVDLNPHLGDVSVLLGLSPRFTVCDALLNPKRLDQDFVNTLITKHPSGISVIAAPEAYDASVSIEPRAVGKFLEVVRNQFPHIVIDAGPTLGLGSQAMFQIADTIYLVTELSIPSLRNAQRFISFLDDRGGSKLALVVNRYDSRKAEFDENHVTKALGMAPSWKIPNDYLAVQRSANTGTPLIQEKSPIPAVLRSMARKACGKPPEEIKKKSWGIFH